MRLRNAAVPLVTVIALSYAGLLEGSVLTETVFAWPGLGLYITNSLQNADMNAVLGGTIVIGIDLHRASTSLSDLLYRLLDPRTRGDDRRAVAPDPPAPRLAAVAENRHSRSQARLGRALSRLAGILAQSARRRSGSCIVLLLILVAVFADMLAPYSPIVGGNLRTERLLPPERRRIWFGTDDLARDIFSRIVYGSRMTLWVVVLVAIIAAPIGLAGRHGRGLSRRLGRRAC